ncbi:MAG TPA: HAD-IA family hydrolase [Micromonosporaceae bacterium]|nr:HAD-IA family hydrolase [Micromonosporaceae bacterium]
MRARATGLLIDLDGVLRVWDAGVVEGVEKRHGLPAGSLLGTALSWPVLRPAVSGEVSHTEWVAEVLRRLVAGGADDVAAGAAVREWQEYRGEVAPEALAFVREVRAAGRPVGLATNATDLLDADLAALGLAGEVDVVVNSSAVGSPKPAKEYFAAACRALALPPDKVLLVDDDDRAVRGARVAGLSAYRWTGPDDLRYVRAALDLG